MTVLTDPDLHVPGKPRTHGSGSIGAGHDVVTAECVGPVDGLDQREVGVGG